MENQKKKKKKKNFFVKLGIFCLELGKKHISAPKSGDREPRPNWSKGPQKLVKRLFVFSDSAVFDKVYTVIRN